MQIKTEFRKYGDNFTLLKHKGKFAVYERVKKNNVGRQYEVVHMFADDEQYYYPSSSFWGNRGWTVLTEEEAFAKFDELITKPKSNRGRKSTKK